MGIHILGNGELAKKRLNDYNLFNREKFTWVAFIISPYAFIIVLLNQGFIIAWN